MANSNTAEHININQQALFTSHLWKPIHCMSHLTPISSLSFQEPILAFAVYQDLYLSDSPSASENKIPSSLLQVFTSVQIPTWKLHVLPTPGPTKETLPRVLHHLSQHYSCKDRWTHRYPVLEWAL